MFINRSSNSRNTILFFLYLLIWQKHLNTLMMNGIKKKLQTVVLTYQEWRQALTIPLPHRSKKQYKRKPKHKNKSYE